MMLRGLGKLNANPFVCVNKSRICSGRSTSIDPEFFARLQLGMFDEILNAYVLTNTSPDIGKLARQLAAFEWNGIRTDRKEPRT